MIGSARIDPIGDTADFERRLLAIPGVVGTGLFLGMAQTVIVEKGGTVEVMERSK
jgi:ribose 5-phosphate isomerase